MELNDILAIVKNAKRSYRDAATKAVLDRPEIISKLIDKTFDINDPLHIKAAWILELVCLQDCTLLNEHIVTFIQGMSTLEHESALRPVSKICSIWCSHYFSNISDVDELKKKEIDQIISCNFDWLIEDHKVATQVYAMDTLKLWGKQEKWINEELRLILEKNADSGTSGYKAHARKLLKNL
jgi:hypothetical protein